MKKTLTFIILVLTALCATAEELYIGTFYVTSQEEETQYGDGRDKWTSRRPAISDMFNFEQPDVLGLQSLTDTQLRGIIAYMTTHQHEGNILYKKTMQLLASGTVEEMPEGCTCSWVKLQKGEKPFYVFNICFTADAVNAAARVVEATKEVNTENLPCIVLGYLGVNEKNSAYSRLNIRFPDCYKKASIISAEFGTVNNFDLAANHGTDRLDYIFAKGITTKAYGHLQYGYYTKETDGSYKRRLPSTHFPVMVKATLP